MFARERFNEVFKFSLHSIVAFQYTSNMTVVINLKRWALNFRARIRSLYKTKQQSKNKPYLTCFKHTKPTVTTVKY